MIPDLLTKSLQGTKFKVMQAMLMNYLFTYDGNTHGSREVTSHETLLSVALPLACQLSAYGCVGDTSDVSITVTVDNMTNNGNKLGIDMQQNKVMCTNQHDELM